MDDPWLVTVQLSGAELAGTRGDARRALEHLEKARVHGGKPGVVAAIDLDRAALLERLGDRSGAAEVLRAVNPRFILAHSPTRALPLARARLLEGDAIGAAALYRQLVERERRHQRETPTLAHYRGLAGDALYRTGMHTEARYALTEAIATYDAVAAPSCPKGDDGSHETFLRHEDGIPIGARPTGPTVARNAEPGGAEPGTARSDPARPRGSLRAGVPGSARVVHRPTAVHARRACFATRPDAGISPLRAAEHHSAHHTA